MMKVLIIQQIIPEYRVAFFSHLKTELEKDNIALSLVYGKSSTNYKSGAQFYQLDWGRLIENKSFKLGKLNLCWQPVGKKYLQEFDLIIIEKSNKLLLNYYLMAMRKFRKIKLGFWGHGRNLQAGLHSVANRFAMLSLNQCDWWWAYTENVKSFIASQNFPKEKITVVQNAIDTLQLQKEMAAISDEELTGLKRELNIRGDEVAIYCGGMYANKRIDFLLEACFLIKKELPGFEIIFIGNGAESYKIQKAAGENDWIHYPGSIHGPERSKYFKLATIQLMPGLVGLGILDSFAMETPIVTTDFEYHSPEIEYLVNGQNGIIAKNSVGAYAQAVIDTFRSKSYLDLISGCRSAAQQYTIESMVQNFKNGIVSCLALN